MYRSLAFLAVLIHFVLADHTVALATDEQSIVDRRNAALDVVAHADVELFALKLRTRGIALSPEVIDQLAEQRSAIFKTASGGTPLPKMLMGNDPLVKFLQDWDASFQGVSKSVAERETEAADELSYPDRNAYAVAKRRYEQEYKHKIADRLSLYRNLKISVYTELSETTTNRASRVVDNTNPIARLVPNFVAVSIGVPTSYFKERWSQNNPTVAGKSPATPTPEELQEIAGQVISEIESAVVPLLPKAPPGKDSYPRVKVAPYAD